MYQGEDGRGGSDAEREGEYGGEGEAGRSAQLPQWLLQVSQHRVFPPGAGVRPLSFLLRRMHSARQRDAGLSV